MTQKAPNIPQKFDWVTARVNCNCDTLFGFLAETVESDVEAMNQHTDGERFLCRTDQDRLIVAIGKSRVVFRKQTDRIVVTAIDQMGNDTQLFTALPHLLSNGSCKMEIQTDEPLELWQVSRRAVEFLFFGGEEL